MEFADEDVFAFELNSPESPVRPFRAPGLSSDSSPASPLLDDGMPFTPKDEPPFGVAPPGNSEIDRDIDEAMRATRAEKRKRSFVPIRHSPLLDPLPEVDEVAMDDEVASSSDAASFHAASPSTVDCSAAICAACCCSSSTSALVSTRVVGGMINAPRRRATLAQPRRREAR